MTNAKNQSHLFFLAGFIGLIFFFLFFSPVLADDPVPGTEEVSIVPNVSDVTPELNKLNKFPNQSPQTVIGSVIKTAMGVVGSLALVMFIYAGFLWMTSAGSTEKSGKAFKIMLWTSLGVILLFSSYAIINFVFGVF